LGGWLVRWQNWLAGGLLIAAVFAGCRLWPHPPLREWKPSSIAVLDDQGRLLRLALAKDDRYRLWVPLDQLRRCCCMKTAGSTGTRVSTRMGWRVARG
jgi:penicillin-binding protein 1C